MGDFKLILGYPGKYDGWSSDFSIGLTHVVDHMGINGDGDGNGDSDSHSRHKRGFEPIVYEDLLDYARRAKDHVQLYNIMSKLPPLPGVHLLCGPYWEGVTKTHKNWRFGLNKRLFSVKFTYKGNFLAKIPKIK